MSILNVAGCGPEPQLMYALRENYTGQGYATECTETMISFCRTLGFSKVVTGVDEQNLSSSRVLVQTGFTQTGTLPGALGAIYTFQKNL